MAIVEPPQHVPDTERSHSLGDEKYDEKHDKSSIQIVEAVAEVYDDVRAIDLDDNGKERPIGSFPDPRI
jgi:hypothetical protein